MDFSQVSKFLSDNNLPAFRQKQILKNYYSGRYLTFADMTDLPKDLRGLLDQKFSLLSVSLEKVLTSPDSDKALLKLGDGQKIETVLMKYDGWITACVSSQVGCPLGCTFCATGKMGFKRNLSVEEIVDQIIFWNNRLYPQYVGRLVFMGMGEPFLNWDNLLAALKTINDKNGLNIGSRKISVSTAGIVPGIKKFAELNTEINLALSLHSADQKVRESIMPIAKQYSLIELKEALNYYTQKTHRQVFLEYALIKDVNDTPAAIKKLIDFVKSNKLFYLNLIPLNPVKGGLDPSDKLKFFQTELTRQYVPFSIRHSVGQSIASACGQLITG